MTNQILKTQNTEWGFWGTTLNNYSEKQTQKRWDTVFKTLLLLTGAKAKEVREFLDSRWGRHYADECYKEKDLENFTMKKYFEWLEKVFFDDEETRKKLETEKNNLLFGTKVYNVIEDKTSILLYTYKNENRINQDYALCLDSNLKQYRIGMDFIKPIDDMDEEELIKYGLK